MKVIDLFAGCGGMSAGFLKNGYDVELAVEIDKEISETYKRNHLNTNVVVEDINKIDRNILENYKDLDVIIGGPPCQGFSMAGARIRDGFIDDPRNYLFKGYFNIVKAIKPKYFVMENVPGLLTMHKGGILREIIKIFSSYEELDGDKYYTHYKIIKADELGIPQKRERLVIIGSLNKDFDFDKTYEKIHKSIKKKHPDFFTPTTIYDAISDLPAPKKNGEVILKKMNSGYQKQLRNSKGKTKNHNQTNHSKVAIARMKKIKPGENFTALNEKIKSVHSGSYGRMEWNQLSVTITTRFDTPAGGRFIHPEENRTITPREAARLQSFDDDFEFSGSRTSICTQIGNAVPPKLSYFLSEFIKELEKRI